MNQLDLLNYPKKAQNYQKKKTRVEMRLKESLAITDRTRIGRERERDEEEENEGSDRRIELGLGFGVGSIYAPALVAVQIEIAS